MREKICILAVALSSCYRADWLVVQYAGDKPYKCWRANDVWASGGGISFQPTQGQLMHLGGAYARVLIRDGNPRLAAEQLGVSLENCSSWVHN